MIVQFLKLGQSDIVLELMYPSYHSLDDAQIESIIGKVDSEDANNLLHVKLGNLSLTKRKESLAQGFNVYQYIAEEIFIAADAEALDSPIKTVSFCSDYIGLWSKDHIKSNIEETYDSNCVILKYTQPEPYRCFESESLSVEMYYSFGSKTPDSHGYHLKTKHFLTVTFKQTCVDFLTAKTEALHIANLFSTLIQRPVDLGNTSYKTESGTFIHRNGLRYRNVIIRKNNYTTNTFKSLTPDVLNGLVSKWCSIYKEHRSSLYTFFEIWDHELLPSEQRFKGYMSVLDDLTTDLKVEWEEKESKSERAIKKFIGRIKDNLHLFDKEAQKEFHIFEMALTGKKKSKEAPIFVRFSMLIQILEPLLPPKRNIDHTFVKRCVHTRHKLTHPQSDYKDIFSSSEYPKAILNLETILFSFMLKLIGAEDELIKHTLRLNAFEPMRYE